VNNFLEGSIGGPPEFHEVKRVYRELYLRSARLERENTALRQQVKTLMSDWEESD